MLKKIFGREKTPDAAIVTAVVDQTSALLLELQRTLDLRFKELSSQIKEVELGLAQMETKLLTKDLRDKQAYGLLHYKLHEAKNTKLADEIKELEAALAGKKETLKDH